MAPPTPTADSSDLPPATLKRRLSRGLLWTWFLAVLAHTLNLQSEAILFRNACKGDLGRTAVVLARCNAVAGLLGICFNQIGGGLSDAFGRSFFYLLGPLSQLAAGAVVFMRPDRLTTLACCKILRSVFTTFSGTVMGAAGMRDCFQGQELGEKMAETGGVIGLGLLAGPVLEASILRRAGAGGERAPFLLLAVVGAANCAVCASIPETLHFARRSALDFGAVLQNANPFSFVRIYTEGTSKLRKLAAVQFLQSTIEGKTLSDFGQIWMREHLQLSIATIAKYNMGFGLAASFAGKQLMPLFLRRSTVWDYTTFTNLTNFAAYTLRGAAESPRLFFGVLPLLLPGVNGAAGAAIGPLVNSEMAACGFSVAESAIWLNNMRACAAIFATLVYAHAYSFCKSRGIFTGYTFTVAGLLGAGLPQALLALCVSRAELGERRGAAGK